MCGRFNLLPDGKTKALMQTLNAKGQLSYAKDIAPGARISFIRQGACNKKNDRSNARVAEQAIWWLLLDHNTLKPNYKYVSFNSRSDKLNQARSLAYHPYRESRCLIPASAFVEGLGDKKTYHKIEIEDRAIAFGGLYKEYTNQDNGEIIYSASIITLPPIEQYKNIHPKSIPLMLDVENKILIDQWLDPEFPDVEVFDNLLQPKILWQQRITPIDKPSLWNPIGESFLIS